ncbi:DUF6192 family protein [Streptomyces sp. NPDC048256]|uniref:DUF6192 family protein n=1 Tax=Streptomyces sp. NPDC048256 TaxID=3154613 RepID=UPI0033D091FE
MKVVEELTRDEVVAAEVTTGLLRRPDVAFKAMGDDTARHQVNRAQVERGQVHENVARVRATLDWIETAVDTHHPQEHSARLPRGQPGLIVLKFTVGNFTRTGPGSRPGAHFPRTPLILKTVQPPEPPRGSTGEK